MELYTFMANSPPIRHWIDPMSAEEHEEFMAEFKKQYNERFGPDSPDPLEWEILVAVANK